MIFRPVNSIRKSIICNEFIACSDYILLSTPDSIWNRINILILFFYLFVRYHGFLREVVSCFFCHTLPMNKKMLFGIITHRASFLCLEIFMITTPSILSLIHMLFFLKPYSCIFVKKKIVLFSFPLNSQKNR